MDWFTFAAEHRSIRLAINVPASILAERDFAANVRRHLPTHASFPGLIVEITEEEAIADPELAREIAIQLKLHNVHISIDDFGAGYSSIARFNDLPFAELKLDRRYVDGCSTDARKRSVCESVAALTHQFKITAVAEGVESEEDLKALIGMGFDMAQGFLFAKPMQKTDFISLLRRQANNGADRAGSSRLMKTG